MFVIIKLYTFKLYSVNKKKNNIYSMEDCINACILNAVSKLDELLVNSQFMTFNFGIVNR